MKNRARQGPSKNSFLYSGSNYKYFPSRINTHLGFFPQNEPVVLPPMQNPIQNPIQKIHSKKGVILK